MGAAHGRGAKLLRILNMTLDQLRSVIADIESNLEGDAYIVKIYMNNGFTLKGALFNPEANGILKLDVYPTGGKDPIAAWIHIDAIAAVQLTTD
jgi:predicted GNAT family N-acyltransferase